MASLANLENQQINGVLGIWYKGKLENLENQQINGVLGIWYNGEFGEFGKSTDQQRFLVPLQKILRMASLANLENQQINGVLGYW